MDSPVDEPVRRKDGVDVDVDVDVGVDVDVDVDVGVSSVSDVM